MVTKNAPSSRTKKLTTLRLVAAIYFLVAGGPYGLEELIQGGGYTFAAIAIIVTPLLFSAPTALMVGELSSAIPEEGGYYAWVKRAMGPRWGFVEAWLSLAASFFDMAIYPTLFLTYLARVFPCLEGGPLRFLLGAVMIAACAIWNLRGARSVGGGSVLFTITLLSPFVILAIFAFVAPHIPENPAVAAPAEGGIGAGLLVAMWNFMGWDNASTFAGEVETPQKTYPRAIAIAVALVTITYLIPVLAVSRSGFEPKDWSTGAWELVGAWYGGRWLANAIVAGGVICGIGMFNVLLLSYSRVPAALAEEGVLPKAFAKTNARGVPVLSVIVCCVLYSMGLFFSFKKLVEIDLLLYGASLVLEFVALALLRVKEPKLDRPFRIPGGIVVAALLGLFPTAFFVVGLATALGDGESHTSAIVAVVGTVVVGVIVWLVRPARSQAKERAPSTKDADEKSR